MSTSTPPSGAPDPLSTGIGLPPSATGTTELPTGAAPPRATPSTDGGDSRAQQTAQTAKDEGKHVAGVAKDEAANVAAEAKAQARDLASELRTHVDEQARTGRDRLVGLFRELGDELEQMASASTSDGMASDLARQAADRSRSVSQFMDQREPGDLVDEVRRFAGRRPGAFLLGALAAGVVAGRLTRGVAAAHDVGTGDGAASPAGYGNGAVGTPGAGIPPVPASKTAAGVTPAGSDTGGRAPTGPVVDPVEPGYPGAQPGVTRP